jgi:hypothetical protein
LRLNATSSAVISEPSQNLTPSRTVSTTLFGSEVSTLEASPGSSFSSGVRWTTDSHKLARMVFSG